MNGNGKRVLVVEDDADAGLLLSTLLDQIGYNVLQVCDGMHALLELNKRRFDVVIADYPMLSICGMELLNHIHARGLETSVILLAEMPTKVMSIDKGLHPFAWLRKPYENHALLDLVSVASHIAARSGKEDLSAVAASR
jgi:DNA-binding NtrC family response regulator